MDYEVYDRLQSELGILGESLKSDIQHLLNLSSADEETKLLIKATIEKVAAEFVFVARMISETLQLVAKSNK